MPVAHPLGTGGRGLCKAWCPPLGVRGKELVAEAHPQAIRKVKQVQQDGHDDHVAEDCIHGLPPQGLEYPVIFMVGLEEGLFPQNRAITNPIELEEERRLCYVAITRAKERLFITHTRFRNIFGSLEVNLPSRFIAELPPHAINYHVDNANYYSDDTEEKIFY